MKIESAKELESLRSRVGDDNFDLFMRLVVGGTELNFFFASEEIESDEGGFSAEEKQRLIHKLAAQLRLCGEFEKSTGEKAGSRYVVDYRFPRMKYTGEVLGITPLSGCNPHGNPLGGDEETYFGH